MTISLATSTSLPIKHTQIRKLSSDELIDLKNKVSELQLHGMKDHQQQAKAQNQVPQHTVLEVKGKVIATFGDNDWRFYPSNSDGGDASITDTEVINSLKLKYGEALKVITYQHGQGPTMGEILERVYGVTPNRVNTTA
ncbi:hypothetical protein [Pseudoalteromonas sp. MMG007]|uniref:hypothetical protein n=1 Tax=Pseudoalteromonas sp. MMG007 TaxID=2822684 RepID=UPI001B386947|nr:hypothetical protein [Pseudoalteromonas sp. MMG007]MBQ4859455.1 hypothetical protein [Pseudoalteromonas sp. MMG007]